MTLILAIENFDRLPDGGPVRFQARARGVDIGRDAHLDWTLPDPDRVISSKHCEIRFRDGGYWLTDVSTNGTFLNGSQQRLAAPTRLKAGDRLTIGRYVIGVALEDAPAPSPVMSSAPAPLAESARGPAPDIWGGGEAAPPESRAAFRANPPARAQGDFLDFAAPVVPTTPASPLFAAPSALPDPWGASSVPVGAVESPPIAPAAFTPAPRRPAPTPVLAIPAPEIADLAPAMGPTSDPLLRILAAAGVDSAAVAGRDPTALADDIGAFLGLTARHLAAMLGSRAETKSLIRSSSRTEIRALENNPLRFQATPAEALAIMLGPPHRSYLGAQAALDRTFEDLKEHQMLTFGAMQAALDALFEDLAPEKIERSVEADKGLGALLTSRKAKLWDVYVERWRAKTKRSDGRLNEAFTALFGQAYDRLQNKGG